MMSHAHGYGVGNLNPLELGIVGCHKTADLVCKRCRLLPVVSIQQD